MKYIFFFIALYISSLNIFGYYPLEKNLNIFSLNETIIFQDKTKSLQYLSKNDFSQKKTLLFKKNILAMNDYNEKIIIATPYLDNYENNNL